MREREIGHYSDGKAIVARMPTREDVESLRCGDFAPDCFGELRRVVEITECRQSIRGQWFVCYYTEFGKDARISQSMKENELVRTLAVTSVMTSAQCDRLEWEMRQELTLIGVLERD
jgi:hypothetical protein